MKPEKDFQAHVLCDYCRNLIYHDDALVVEKQGAGGVIRLTFCNETHANEYYLAKLRQSGM